GEPPPFAVGDEIEAVAGSWAALGNGADQLVQPPCPVLLGQDLQLGVDRLVQLARQQNRRVPVDIGDGDDGCGAEQRKIGKRQAKWCGPEELSERCHGCCSRRRGPCAGGGCQSSCRSWTEAGKCGRRVHWSADRNDSPRHSRATWCASRLGRHASSNILAGEIRAAAT